MSSSKRTAFIVASVAAFFFSIQLASTTYTLSTFAANLAGEANVGAIYTIGALVTIFGLYFFAPHRLKKRGSVGYLGGLLLIDLICLFGLTLPVGIFAKILFLIGYLAANTLSLYGLDIIVEHTSNNKITGRLRGVYLTVINLAWVLGPFIASRMINLGGYPLLFTLAGVLVLFSIAAITYREKELTYKPNTKTSLKKAWNVILKHKDIRIAMLMQFVLQFFYAWMVIFAPFYLHEVGGFSLSQIGVIFLVMLLPFIFVQYPLGRLADKRLGEKELLIGGLVVLAITTVYFGTLGPGNIWLWAAILFATRIGAATFEVMIETYFFKKVDVSDTAVIGVYRSMFPLAYAITPILGTVIALQLGYGALFSILGVLLFAAIIPAVKLHDTR